MLEVFFFSPQLISPPSHLIFCLKQRLPYLVHVCIQSCVTHRGGGFSQLPPWASWIIGFPFLSFCSSVLDLPAWPNAEGMRTGKCWNILLLFFSVLIYEQMPSCLLWLFSNEVRTQVTCAYKQHQVKTRVMSEIVSSRVSNRIKSQVKSQVVLSHVSGPCKQDKSSLISS